MARLDKLNRLLAEKKDWVNQNKKGFLRYRQPFAAVRHMRAGRCDFSKDTVIIGDREDISPDEHKQVLRAMEGFMPWRKGPFKVFGIDIDAEWCSQRKWNRIVPQLPDLKGKIIADIGCNNGYYMFRMAHHKPEFILGLEPYLHHYFTFRTLNSFAGCNNLRIELLGIEHLNLLPECFDIILCLGILYHRQSPIDALREVQASLKPGGTLIIESQAIPGESSIALFPEKTYAKVPGTWFVPTASCLKNWLSRCGFIDISMFCTHPMSNLEQRRTKWMLFESYEDFIDSVDPDKTVEGYPAPWRVYLKAVKP